MGSGSRFTGRTPVGGAVNIVPDQGGGPLHGQFRWKVELWGFSRARFACRGAFGDKLKYSVGFLHLNVINGVDGQDANRSAGLQAIARYDFTSKMQPEWPFLGLG